MDKPINRLEETSSPVYFLDLLRAVAAVLVAFGHVRLLLVVDANRAGHLNLLQKAFYFITSLGSDCVLVFFVLSGFLVGGTVVRDLRLRRWSWHQYIIARVSRIYVVLLPAVFVGVVVDLLGVALLAKTHVYGDPYYAVSLPRSILANITVPIVLGNLLSLQDILVPPVGSNHALWSLTNEVWYYAIFPLFAVCFSPRVTFKVRVLFLAVCLSLLIALPTSIVSLFVVWLMGVGISLLPRVNLPSVFAWALCVVLLLLLAAQSAKLFQGSQFATAGVAALLIYAWLAKPQRPVKAWVGKLWGSLASVSYSLYVFHSPFVVFMAALILRERDRYEPSISGVGVACLVLLASMAYASIMWFLFERQTPRVRRKLSEHFTEGCSVDVAPGPVTNSDR